MNRVRQLISLLDGVDRRRLFVVLALSVITALLETLGVASTLPFLAVVASPEAALENRWVMLIYSTLGFENTNSFLIFLGCGIFALLVVTNSMAALTMWALFRFSWLVGHRISLRLFRDYVFRPYEFFLNRNSAELGAKLLGEVLGIVQGVILPAIRLIAKGVSALFIVALLLIADPVLALVVTVVLGGIYGLIFVLLRRRVTALGRARFLANIGRYQAANEAFGGIKDIKVLGRERSYVKRFAGPSKTHADSEAASQVLGMLPTYGLEVIVFGGILLIVLYQLAFGGSVGEILPMIGLYAFASYRLKPAMTQIFNSMTKLRYNVISLDRLYGDLRPREQVVDSARQALGTLSLTDTLELRGVTYCYPGADVPVVDRFDLMVKANTSIALVGSTGSGKTTLVDIIMGLLAPQQGELVVDGQPLAEGPSLGAWQNSVGYVPQHIYLSDISIAWNIAFGVPETEIDMVAVERAARLANIHDFIVDELSNGYETVVGERGVRLSGGQRQRIGIARALYHDPEVLILDEATSALDGVTEESIFTAVDGIKHAKTVIMVAHRISTVRNCDAIYLLDRGRIIAQGTYDQLLLSSETFRTMALGRGQGARETVSARGRPLS